MQVLHIAQSKANYSPLLMQELPEFSTQCPVIYGLFQPNNGNRQYPQPCVNTSHDFLVFSDVLFVCFSLGPGSFPIHMCLSVFCRMLQGNLNLQIF